MIHALVPGELQGFILTSDARAEGLLKRLAKGWFIEKTRMKNLVAIKVEEELEQVGSAGAKELIPLPTARKPAIFRASFKSSTVDLEAVRGERRDRSTAQADLFIPGPARINPEEYVFFTNGVKVYAVHRG